METDVDVAVVGAGYAGLSAARALQRAGLAVSVIEARERVGGRVLTERAASGAAIDLGGMWTGPGQDRMRALAREYGAATFLTHTSGDSLLVDRWGRHRYTGDLPPGPLHVRALLAIGIARLRRLAGGVDPERPWGGSTARRLDATTVAAWLRANVPSPRARRLLEVAIGESSSIDPDRLSLLAFLAAVRSGGDPDGHSRVAGGAQQDLFVDGAEGPARAIAAELGSALRTGTPVTSVRRVADGVVVCGTGVEVVARRAVVALASALAGRIGYDPPLPGLRDQLTQRTPMGAMLKVVAVYDRPFWRDEGLAGQGSGRRRSRPRSHGRLAHRRPGPSLRPDPRPSCPLAGGPRARRAAHRDPRGLHPVLRVTRRVPRRVVGEGVGRRPLLPGWVRGFSRARRAHERRRGPARSHRSDPLGRQRDGLGLGRIHGGRGALGRAGGGGGAARLGGRVTLAPDGPRQDRAGSASVK